MGKVKMKSERQQRGWRDLMTRYERSGFAEELQRGPRQLMADNRPELPAELGRVLLGSKERTVDLKCVLCSGLPAETQ